MDDKFVEETCKPGTVDCCRYLLMGGGGWECGKFTDFKDLLDVRVANNTIRATGDNCPGVKNG